jgi:tetratricopeptide (TPR) repeat protein
LTTRSNLARAYQSEGRADDAVELSEAVVADYVRVLGADQQPTLVARNDLAEMYRAVGRLADAVDVWQALLADCRRTLGESHSLTRGVAQSMRAMA